MCACVVENQRNQWFTGAKHTRIYEHLLMETKMLDEINIVMPQKVSYIIEALYERGYEAFAVGGCIRDCLLGREPKDWDITTNALPLDVKSIFPKTVDTGIEHGTVTVLLGGEGFEVTTYRIDGEYEDARHPKNVEFTGNLKLDLMRRDFTINAMAYNDKVGLVDEFEGKKDLQDRLIRCVGAADTRFEEDALRILRAVRFSAQLGFSIHEDTCKAIKKKAPLLKKISAERIKVELDKTLVSANPDRLLFAAQNNVFDHILCRLGGILVSTQGNVLIEQIDRLRNVYDKKQLRINEKQFLAICWTILIQNYNKEEAKQHYRDLKSDNELLRLSCALIEAKDENLIKDSYSIRKLVCKIGKSVAPCFFAMKWAMANTEEERLHVKECEDIFKSEENVGHCMQLSDMKVSGKDLIKAGIQPGRHMGDLLNLLLEGVLANPENNNKEKLIEIALEYDGKMGIKM